MNEDKKWIMERDPIPIWTCEIVPNQSDEIIPIVSKYLSLAADMFEDFYKGTDTDVFELVNPKKDYKFKSEVRIFGEDNALFTTVYTYSYTKKAYCF